MQLQIHQYQISQTDYQSEQSSPVLSTDEQARAARFINLFDRIRYVSVHRFMRTKLADHLNCKPAAIEFGHTEYGKPYITSPPTPLHPEKGECSTHFNLSYRGDYALMAISNQPVGIDIEQIRNIDNVDAFCSAYFHANERAIIDATAPSEQSNTIFTFWTFKEAFIKALGIGFSRDLTGFDLSPFYYSPTHSLPFLDGNTFTIERVEVPDGYWGAVAYRN